MSSLKNKDCNYISNKEIEITFDGKSYSAYEGDTIASALLRNNIRLIGRSFKYHRPRGIYTCGIEEPNALVQILNEGASEDLLDLYDRQRRPIAIEYVQAHSIRNKKIMEEK